MCRQKLKKRLEAVEALEAMELEEARQLEVRLWPMPRLVFSPTGVVVHVCRAAAVAHVDAVHRL